VVLTESLARRAFGADSPIGRQIAGGNGARDTVIGVVRDTRQRQLVTGSADMMFMPFRPQASTPWATIVVGLSAPADVVIPALPAAVAALDPTLPLYDVARVDEAIRAQFADDALLMTMAVLFALLATSVAGVGLAGVLGRMLAERRREFAIRAALGATPRRIVGLLASEALLVLVIGLAAGLAANWWLGRLLTARLFGVPPHDAVSMAAGVVTVSFVTAGCVLPVVRRAARLIRMTSI
jgi:putative ABC transport system permease protein